LKQGGFSHASASSIFEHFFGGEDPFSSLFGGRGGRERGPPRTRDMMYQLPVPLSDFYNGKTRKLKVTKTVICEDCEGTGSKTKSEAPTCADCNGRGIKVEIRQMAPGFITQTQSTCSTCRGEGKRVNKKDECPNCKGQKVVEKVKILEVNIIQGMRHGERIVFERQSDQMPGAISGDLIVVLVERQDNSPWTRLGDDLLYEVNISLVEALTGFKFQISHMDGRILHVNSEEKDIIKPGDLRKIPGEGMPMYKNFTQKGELYIKFEIEFPTYNQIKSHVKELKASLPEPKKHPEPPKPKKAKKSKDKEKKEEDKEVVELEVVAKPVDLEKMNRLFAQAQQRAHHRAASAPHADHDDDGGAEEGTRTEGGGGCAHQ